MEEDKLLDELKCVRKEIEKLKRVLKRSENENKLISSVFFFIPLGLATFFYFTNMLNEAISAKAIEWVAWLGLIVGILMMMFPSILASRRRKSCSE